MTIDELREWQRKHDLAVAFFGTMVDGMVLPEFDGVAEWKSPQVPQALEEARLLIAEATAKVQR